METIRIKNFRSIVDSGEIRLNELNLLIGKNSSGKSSFLRLFPMFKESSRHELRGPILWFDETYDFGGYQTALSRSRTEDEMLFSFSWKHSGKAYGDGVNDILFYYPLEIKQGALFSVSFSISKGKQQVFLKHLTICIDNEVKIEVESNDYDSEVGVYINSKKVNCQAEWDYNTKTLLPSLRIKDDMTNRQKLTTSLLGLESENEKKLRLPFIYYNGVCLTEGDVMLFLRSVAKSASVSFKASSINKNSSEFQSLMDSLLAYSIRLYSEYVNLFISRYFSHSYYITPLRYNFLRYMRNRELSIDYIESSGKNVLEYILSLSDKSRESYVSFIKNTLGIQVAVIGEENKSIEVINNEGEKDNIVDIGYGFSQVLPIATTLWDRAYMKKDSGVVETIVIEQPEVHLHPAMQADLAKLFIAAIDLAKRRGKKLCLIIETHSSRLVNRIGRCIYNSNNEGNRLEQEGIPSIPRSSVSLFLFEKKDGKTSITQKEYDQNGRIIEWPIGFLD